MTDKPILFSGPMVQALIEGRKTQTRRVLKLAGVRPDYIGPSGCEDDPTCWGWWDDDAGGYITVEGDEDSHPIGWRDGWRDWIGAYRPGDRLWVRETWSGPYLAGDTAPRLRDASLRNPIWYWADGNPENGDWEPPRPSIHMPRWASRLTLVVSDVRVQRLQNISKADAVAEGVPNARYAINPISSFQRLWDSLNAEREPWDRNPWVAALTFEVHRCNIDQMEARHD